MQLVIHLVERPQAFAEARRVLAPDGRLVDRHLRTWSTSPSTGSTASSRRWRTLDRARFPTPDELVAELRAAGFEAVRLVPLAQRVVIDRDWALAKVRGRFISTLQLLDEDEFRSGLVRLEAELPERVEYALAWVVAVAQ